MRLHAFRFSLLDRSSRSLHCLDWQRVKREVRCVGVQECKWKCVFCNILQIETDKSVNTVNINKCDIFEDKDFKRH